MDRVKREIEKLILQGECLSLELKSDLKCLPDRDLVATVVSLANIEGGDLLLGVEDDGAATGLNANHLNVSGIPGNPLLANVIKRIGLAERTGSGIDRINEGMLRLSLKKRAVIVRIADRKGAVYERMR